MVRQAPLTALLSDGGRGAAHSTCILLYQGPLGPTARDRLKIIYENTDGFEVARHDLRIRGPGELLGARQSGVPMLRFADLSLDIAILDAARDTAGARDDRSCCGGEVVRRDESPGSDRDRGKVRRDRAEP